jgi:hypothetical protein
LIEGKRHPKEPIPKNDVGKDPPNAREEHAAEISKVR